VTRFEIPRLGLLLTYGIFALLGRAVSAQEKPASLDDLLEAKVSGAARYEQTARRAPASVTVVTSDDIERFAYRTLADVLGSVRGFYVSYDRNYTYVGVRGFSRPTDYNNRIRLLIDGHTLNENFYGTALLGSEFGLDLNAVDRIEIIRGPGSALYGTGAMLAVVNVILKKGNAVGNGSASVGAGSFGRSSAFVAGGTETKEGLDLFAAAFGSNARGQDLYYPQYASDPATHGVARGLDSDRSYGFLASASYKGFEVLGLTTSREKAIPTGSFGTVFGAPGAETTDKQQFLDVAYKADIGSNLTLQTRVFADSYGYKGQYPYGELQFDGTDDNWYGGEAQLQWDPRPDNRVIAGVEYRRDTRADYRDFTATQTFFRGNFPSDVMSAYFQDEYQVTENLILFAGLRYDRYSTGFGSTSPKGALIYYASPASTLKLLYGQAFRAPNAYEVHFEDPLSGAEGNPNLKPERIETVEATWEQRFGPSVSGAVSLYQSRFRDLIDQTIDPTNSLLQFRNIQSVTARGVELDLRARFAGGLGAYGSYSFQHARDGRSGEPLTNSPEQVVKLGLSHPLGRGLSASADLIYETSRLTVQDTRTDPYFLTNATVTFDPAGAPLRLQFQVRNLFNTSYALPGGLEHRQDAIPQDGRNFFAKVEYRF
jgi:outer membrane receptor protein involved in Fe transport